MIVTNISKVVLYDVVRLVTNIVKMVLSDSSNQPNMHTHILKVLLLRLTYMY